MNIYTKTGDRGTTSLVGGTRVSKTDIRLDAYGTVDELNSFIGWLNVAVNDEKTGEFLLYVQHQLFAVGAYLATESDDESAKASPILSSDDVARVEHEIDAVQEVLPKINKFILPGGSESGARAHVCRTVARRAERLIYQTAQHYPVCEDVLKFINRLSDYFFVLARKESAQTGEEIFWNPAKK